MCELFGKSFPCYQVSCSVEILPIFTLLELWKCLTWWSWSCWLSSTDVQRDSRWQVQLRGLVGRRGSGCQERRRGLPVICTEGGINIGDCTKNTVTTLILKITLSVWRNCSCKLLSLFLLVWTISCLTVWSFYWSPNQALCSCIPLDKMLQDTSETLS